MSGTDKPEKANRNVQANLPEPGRLVLVQCERFRCLAFRDSKGGWKDYYSREDLNVVRIVAVVD